MLRSFTYAARVAGVEPTRASRSGARASFLDGYFDAVAASRRPAAARDGRAAAARSSSSRRRSTSCGYELANRPDWVSVPVVGICACSSKQRRDGRGRSRAGRPRATTRTRTTCSARTANGGKQVVVRAFRPEAERVRVLPEGGEPVELERCAPGRRLRGRGARATLPLRYRLDVAYPDGLHVELDDPYSFLPTLGELDLHLASRGPPRAAVREARRARPRGRRRRAARRSPSGRRTRARSASSATSTAGTAACTRCARSARRASGSSSCRASTTARATSSSSAAQDGAVHLRADPYALATEQPPQTASVVFTLPRTSGGTASGSRERERRRPLRAADLDLRGAPRLVAARGSPTASSAEQLGGVRPRPRLHARRAAADHGAPVRRLVGLPGDELLRADRRASARPTTSAPSSTRCTSRGSACILDWVPAHFPRDEWALARFDGTALYEHADPQPRRASRLGHARLQPRAATRCGTSCSRARSTGCSEYHADGLRVDAVASMLYLDYSRKEGEWIPNAYGGREDLDSIAFLRELNEVVHADQPGRDLGGRGVDRVAGRLAADLPRRARLRLQVEHGLDARHARLLRERPGLPPVPPPRADVLDDLRLHRELHPAALARRGRARQGLAARRRCRATAGSSSRTCARSTRTCGRIRARSCSSWAASSRRSASGTTTTRSTGTCSSGPSTPACSASCAT